MQPENPPPTYDSAVNAKSINTPSEVSFGTESTMDVKKPIPSQPNSPSTSAPPFVPPTAPVMPTVYHYVHPTTQHQITTFLPPDHPEMICLQEGTHINETRFGMLGILAAIFWFPLGVGLCLLDRRVRCVRCGASISDGITC